MVDDKNYLQEIENLYTPEINKLDEEAQRRKRSAFDMLKESLDTTPEVSPEQAWATGLLAIIPTLGGYMIDKGRGGLMGAKAGMEASGGYLKGIEGAAEKQSKYKQLLAEGELSSARGLESRKDTLASGQLNNQARAVIQASKANDTELPPEISAAISRSVDNKPLPGDAELIASDTKYIKAHGAMKYAKTMQGFAETKNKDVDLRAQQLGTMPDPSVATYEWTNPSLNKDQRDQARAIDESKRALDYNYQTMMDVIKRRGIAISPVELRNNPEAAKDLQRYATAAISLYGALKEANPAYAGILTNQDIQDLQRARGGVNLANDQELLSILNVFRTTASVELAKLEGAREQVGKMLDMRAGTLGGKTKGAVADKIKAFKDELRQLNKK